MKVSLLYRGVLILAGIGVVLWGLHLCYPVISTGTLIIDGPGDAYSFSRMTYLPFPSLVLFTILFFSLGYMSVGILLFCLSTLRVDIAYWGLHTTLWMMAIALWYHWAFLSGGGIYDYLWPFETSPLTLLPWLGGAILGSFLLTRLHRPIDRFFYRLFTSIH